MRGLSWFRIGGTQEPGEGELEKQQRDPPPLLSASGARGLCPGATFEQIQHLGHPAARVLMSLPTLGPQDPSSYVCSPGRRMGVSLAYEKDP